MMMSGNSKRILLTLNRLLSQAHSASLGARKSELVESQSVNGASSEMCLLPNSGLISRKRLIAWTRDERVDVCVYPGRSGMSLIDETLVTVVENGMVIDEI